jgi:hypothetical protein
MEPITGFRYGPNFKPAAWRGFLSALRSCWTQPQAKGKPCRNTTSFVGNLHEYSSFVSRTSCLFRAMLAFLR